MNPMDHGKSPWKTTICHQTISGTIQMEVLYKLYEYGLCKGVKATHPYKLPAISGDQETLHFRYLNMLVMIICGIRWGVYGERFPGVPPMFSHQPGSSTRAQWWIHPMVVSASIRMDLLISASVRLKKTTQNSMGSDRVYVGCGPPPSNSDHQDYEPFLIGNPGIPS